MSLKFAISFRSLATLALATALYYTPQLAPAATYSFMTVTGNGIGGNAATSQFTSLNGFGVITVTHSFSAGGNGPDDNNNPAIFPSNFSAIFPGTGNVQGHLAQTLYSNTSVVTFMLPPTLSPTTVFGMWNTTDQVAQPAYRIELIDSLNNPVPPTTFAIAGTGDNTGSAGVPGAHQMMMNPITGDVSFGAVINGGAGIHTNALFWNGIPIGTKMIKVYGNLGPLPGNTMGDGVGYYFADQAVPEPASIALFALGLFTVGAATRRRFRSTN